MTQFAKECRGCHTSILLPSVEVTKEGEQQSWHPECYTMTKVWDIELSQMETPKVLPGDSTSLARRTIVQEQYRIIEKQRISMSTILAAYDASYLGLAQSIATFELQDFLNAGVPTANNLLFLIDTLCVDLVCIEKFREFFSWTRIDLNHEERADINSVAQVQDICCSLAKFRRSFQQVLRSTRKSQLPDPLKLEQLQANFRAMVGTILLAIVKSDAETGTSRRLDLLSQRVAANLQSNMSSEFLNKELMNALGRDDSDLCSQCSKPIGEGDSFLASDVHAHVVHTHCLSCSVCKRGFNEPSLRDCKWGLRRGFYYCPVHLSSAASKGTYAELKYITVLGQCIFSLCVELSRCQKRLRLV